MIPFRPYRQRMLAPLALVPALALALAPAARAAPPATATYHYYVAADGSDANPGTDTRPFETILRASRLALPGTTVHVAPGTYPGGFRTTMSGTRERRIAYVSSTRGGARIVPRRGAAGKAAWDNRGNFVDIVGFQIDGRDGHGELKWSYGIYNAGSDTLIMHNHVHHVAHDIPCTSAGAAGINVDSYYKGRQSDVSGNTVHDIGSRDCRFAHGINLSTTGSVTNNVVFAIGGVAIQMWHDATNVVVSNNTVSGAMTGILIGGGDSYYLQGPNDFTNVHNNIVYDNKYGITEQGKTGAHNSYRNNLVYQNTAADWKLSKGLKHSGTVTQAPQFLRYGKAVIPDFRLRSTSPAIGTGTDQHATLTDIGGKLRAREIGIDIGAHQRQQPR